VQRAGGHDDHALPPRLGVEHAAGVAGQDVVEGLPAHLGDELRMRVARLLSPSSAGGIMPTMRM
jgi:hypothetical protein